MTDNEVKDTHFKETEVSREKEERQPGSNSGEQGLQGTEGFQAFPTKRTT